VSLKQKILLSIIILVLFNLLLIILFGDKGFVDSHLLKIERDGLIEKNKKLNRENLALYREIDRLKNDPEYIENVARQELGLVGKEDIIFKVKDGNKIKK
jgi:cell division protein FtsB